MSISPGSNVISPSSTTRVPSGTLLGATSAMCSPSTSSSPGVRYSPRVTSRRRAARSNVGGCGVLEPEVDRVGIAVETLLSYDANVVINDYDALDFFRGNDLIDDPYP